MVTTSPHCYPPSPIAGTQPRCVIAHTVKGKGVEFMEQQIGWHLGYLAKPDEDRVLAELRGGAVVARSSHGFTRLVAPPPAP